MSLLAELKRRNVLRAGAFYAASAWLLVQVATQVFPFFHIAEWVVRWVVVTAAIGFPFAMVFSWFYEWTPHGLQLESEVAFNESVTRQTGKKLDRWIIVILVLAVVLLLTDKLVLRKAADEVAAAPDKSIAVMRFTDLSPGHDQEYFSDGIADEILNSLSKVSDLKVAGRTSSYYFKGRNEDLQTIGSTLGVAHVLEGSVRKQGEKVRITAQLIQVKDGFNLWSESYDGDLSDVFELQERIARAITDVLKVLLSGEQHTRLVDVGTSNAEAYALFLQATSIFNRRDGARMPGAIVQLERAIALDSGYARAHARLALGASIATQFRASEFTALLATTEKHAQAAMALDPLLAESHVALGFMEFTRRRYVEALREYQRALVLDPNDVNVNYFMGVSLALTGYGRQAAAALDRTLTLDPLLPTALFWRGSVHFNDGEIDAAERLYQRASDVGLAWAGFGLAEVAAARGHRTEAISLVTPAYRVTMSDLPAGAAETYAAGTYGDAEARATALAMISAYLESKPAVVAPMVPVILLRLGEAARSLAIAQERLGSDGLYLRPLMASPAGKPARSLPQFAEFARKIGFAALWEQHGPPDMCRRVGKEDFVCE